MEKVAAISMYRTGMTKKTAGQDIIQYRLYFYFISGGILCYLDFLVLVSKWPLKHYCGVDSTYVYYVFLLFLFIILLWYI